MLWPTTGCVASAHTAHTPDMTSAPAAILTTVQWQQISQQSMSQPAMLQTAKVLGAGMEGLHAVVPYDASMAESMAEAV